MIRTKSVRTPADPREHGLRILATRFRGRGLPASTYDVWMPNLAPSEGLLRQFLEGGINWAEFSRSYRAEVRAVSPGDEQNRTIKNHGQKFTLRLLKTLGQRGPVTLLCHCAEDEPHCHRHLLRALIEKV